LKIIILQGAFLPVPPTLGGAVEKMWFALGKNFAKQGHEVKHISRSYPDLKEEEIIDGVKHKRIPGYTIPSSGIYLKWLDLLYTIRARKIIPIDCDIVITNTFWAPILLSSRLRRRCVVDVARIPKGQMKWYKKSLMLRANSAFVASAIKQELPDRNHEQVIMIPNPLPFDNLIDIDQSRKKNILLYTGRVHPEKGLEILINAFKALKGNWKLKIVGPWEISAGGGGLMYLQRLKQLAADTQVEFTGPVFNTNKLHLMYQEASVFIYPSVAEKGETFGLAPLEAMAWGCVPIVSNLECFKDFIKDGINGLVFDHRNSKAVELLENSIARLQNDDSLMSKLSREALKVRDSHSTFNISLLFLETFSQMINKKKLSFHKSS